MQVSRLLVPWIPLSLLTSGHHLEKGGRLENKKDQGTWLSCHSSAGCPTLGFIIFPQVKETWHRPPVGNFRFYNRKGDALSFLIVLLSVHSSHTTWRMEQTTQVGSGTPRGHFAFSSPSPECLLEGHRLSVCPGIWAHCCRCS